MTTTTPSRSYLPRVVNTEGEFVAPRGSLEFAAFGSLDDATMICQRLAVPFVVESDTGRAHPVPALPDRFLSFDKGPVFVDD